MLDRHWSMVTSSNGNIFRVTDPLGEEFPPQRPAIQSLDVFFDLRLDKRMGNNWEAYDLRRLRAHYDVTASEGIDSRSYVPQIYNVIGIDHDTVCAGTTSAVPDCSTNHDSADRISGQFLFYHDHNLQKVRETCVFDVLYRCSSPSTFA